MAAVSVQTRIGRAGTATLLGLASLTIMVGCVIAPGLGSIALGLDVPRAAGWLMTVPALGVVLSGRFVGALIDRIGAYRVLCGGLALYGLLGAGGLMMRGAVAVFADRLLLGSATAAVMVGGTALIAHFFEGDRRLAMIARQGMAIELGGVIFLAFGGLLATFGWWLPFLLYLAAWIFLALLIAFVPRPSRAAADHTPAGSPPKRLRDLYAMGLASMVAFFVGIIVLPLQMQGQGFTAGQIGFFLSFVSLIAVGFAGSLPWLTKRAGERRVFIAAFLMYGAAHALFAAAVPMSGMIVAAFLMGGGFGLSIPLVNHSVVERSAPQQRGRALGTLSMVLFLGQFLSSFVTLIPGGASTPFLCAAVLCLGTATFLAGVRTPSLPDVIRSSPATRQPRQTGRRRSRQG